MHRLGVTPLTLLIAVSLVAWIVFWSFTEPRGEAHLASYQSRKFDRQVEVSLVAPTKGGLPRKITQTGTLEPQETAKLSTRVSGYIKSFAFDIGDYVEEGDVVVEIEAEELLKDVEKQAARLEQAESRVVQFRAQVKTAAADLEASIGCLKQTEAEILRYKAQAELRQKQLKRIQLLVADRAVESKLADEKRFELEAAKAGVEYAKASRIVAEAEVNAIRSRVDKAEADVLAAKADVRVALTDLARAHVMANYCQIRSPFAGVVTARNYDRGEFVQTASNGGKAFLLTIARTDHMRAVLQVPAPDVPFVRPGQTADVEVSALGGRILSGTISRIAHNSDRRTRTMRVEVDLPNPDNALAGGMYGAITIEVPAPENQLTIPRACFVGRTLNGKGRVYELVDGRLNLLTVGIGRSNESKVEILEGLSTDSKVVLASRTEFAEMRDGLAALPRQPKADPNSLLDSTTVLTNHASKSPALSTH